MTDNTTDTFRSAIQTVHDMAPPAPVLPAVSRREPLRRPVAALVSAFAAVLVVVGLGTLAIGQGSNETQDVGAGGSEPTSGVLPADAGLAPLDALPMIGTILQGWEIGMATEEESADGGGLRTALYYKVVNDDTIFANLWIRGITEDSVYEGDYLMSDQLNLEELTIRGHDARMLTVDSDNFEFVWRDSPTAVVRLAVNTEAAEESGRDLALVFADSLIDLTPEMWADYLDLSGSAVPSSPTTTLAE